MDVLSGAHLDETIIWYEHDGSPGCTDAYAGNYDSAATTDDGSCSGYPDNGNHALSFDGVDDYVELARRPINSNTSDLSVGLWFKSTQTSSGALYFESVINGRGIWIRMEPVYNRIRTYSGSSGAYNIVSTSAPYNDGVWHLLTYTVSNGNLTEIYIDGEKVAENTGSFNTDPTQGSAGIIGRMGEPGYGNPYDYFHGNIDQLMIWNYTLTQEEIESHMTTPPTGNENGLVGYYKFNSGTDNVLYDHSGNANHGTINGASWVTFFQPQTKEELQTAVDLWVSDNASALANYGEINSWDVSLITDMSELFMDKTTFNDDISNWDVSSVTTVSYTHLTLPTNREV